MKTWTSAVIVKVCSEILAEGSFAEWTGRNVLGASHCGLFIRFFDLRRQ